MSQRPIDDPVGFATALAMGLIGMGLIALVASIAGGILAAPIAVLNSPLVQGLCVGVGIICLAWELRWFMKLAKHNGGQGPSAGR